MNLSSESVFHFTEKLDTLKSILSDKFYASYCIENFDFNGEKVQSIIPMICFCDIPLKNVSQNTAYGKFGIGMSRDWAKKNGLNPVFYFEKESLLTELFVKSFKSFNGIFRYFEIERKKLSDDIELKENKKNNSNDVINELKTKLNDLENILSSFDYIYYNLNFAKYYEDDLVRNEKVVKKKHKFYDEKEWRYVPKIKDLIKKHIDFVRYKEWRGDIKANKPILEDVFLKFEFSDINYIIIEKENNLKGIIDFILKMEKISEKEKYILISKIYSIERIRKDM